MEKFIDVQKDLSYTGIVSVDIGLRSYYFNLTNVKQGCSGDENGSIEIVLMINTFNISYHANSRKSGLSIFFPELSKEELLNMECRKLNITPKELYEQFNIPFEYDKLYYLAYKEDKDPENKDKWWNKCRKEIEGYNINKVSIVDGEMYHKFSEFHNLKNYTIIDPNNLRKTIIDKINEMNNSEQSLYDITRIYNLLKLN